MLLLESLNMKIREGLQLTQRLNEISDIAIDMSKERRILLDFLYTAAAPNKKDGSYTHDRQELYEKAIKVIKELDV